MRSPDSEATPLVRIYLVRHGETQANRDGIIQGQQDMALNAMGEEQARLVGEALKGVEFGRAFSSDLSRAVKVRGSALSKWWCGCLRSHCADRRGNSGASSGGRARQRGGAARKGECTGSRGGFSR
jgi:bisphosphoglycerate-dependent phosphoglycerate mutase